MIYSSFFVLIFIEFVKLDDLFYLYFTVVYLISLLVTRMHSSRMHTPHLLTVSQHAMHRVVVGGVSQHALGRGWVYPSMHWAGRCVYPSMHSAEKGVCPGVCVCGRHTPVDRMTDMCKNITFPQTLFANGN